MGLDGTMDASRKRRCRLKKRKERSLVFFCVQGGSRAVPGERPVAPCCGKPWRHAKREDPRERKREKENERKKVGWQGGADRKPQKAKPSKRGTKARKERQTNRDLGKVANQRARNAPRSRHDGFRPSSSLCHQKVHLSLRKSVTAAVPNSHYKRTLASSFRAALLLPHTLSLPPLPLPSLHPHLPHPHPPLLSQPIPSIKHVSKTLCFLFKVQERRWQGSQARGRTPTVNLTCIIDRQ